MKNVIYIILFILYSTLVLAQEQNGDSYWISTGLGVNFLKLSDSDVGFNFAMTANYEIHNNVISYSYMRSSEFVFFNHPGEYIKSHEILYGRSFDFSMEGLLIPFPFLIFLKKEFNYSVIGKIGISYNERLKRTELENDDFFDNSYNSILLSGMGFPIMIEIREDLTDYLGMGLSFYTNFNNATNYSGINFH
ncbi:MAG: hypothetical protein KKD86_06115 [Bacteroidetes bacterium]|nr:hypothetical protein [Bacteroidota bacterium]